LPQNLIAAGKTVKIVDIFKVIYIKTQDIKLLVYFVA